ncbi:MAG: SAV_6107 family HEPN domain-containing protein [Nocardioidaceae bacterium]
MFDQPRRWRDLDPHATGAATPHGEEHAMAYAFESGSLQRGSGLPGPRRDHALPGAKHVGARTALRPRAHRRAARGGRRARSSCPSAPNPGLCNAWTLLATVAPELSEWGEFFAAAALKRAAAASGAPHVVTSREADDLVRAVEQFLTVAERALRLSHEPSVGPAR